jgi:hypothetical protein
MVSKLVHLFEKEGGKCSKSVVRYACDLTGTAVNDVIRGLCSK